MKLDFQTIDILTCNGEVVEKVITDSQKSIRLTLSVRNQHGKEKLARTALINI